MNHSTATSNWQFSPRSFTRHYIIALSLLAMLTIVGQLLAQWALYQQSRNAHIINIAERQHMLSEKLTKTALLIQLTDDAQKRPLALDNLKNLLNLLEKYNKWPQFDNTDMGLGGKNSATLTRLFAERQPHYQAMNTAAKNLLAAIRQNASDLTGYVDISILVKKIVAEQAAFVRQMDEIMFQYEASASDQVNLAKWISFILATVILIVLLSEGLYLFRPAVRQIQQTLQALVKTKEKIQQQADKLRERKDMLHALLNAIPESAFLMASNGIVLNANETTVQRLGTTLDKFIGAHAFNFIIPSYLAETRKKQVDKVISTGRPARFEDVHHGRHIDNFIFPVGRLGKKVTKLAIIGFDITEHRQTQAEIRKLNEELEQRVVQRTCQLEATNQKLKTKIASHKQTEMALRTSEERYRRIVDTVQEGIWVLDAQFNTSFVNHRMAEMLGYTVPEMLGHSAFDFMDEMACIEAQQYFERRKQGIKEQYDFRLRCKDGSNLWTIINANPLINDNGQFMGVLTMIIDITARKQAETERQESFNLLQKVLSSLNEAVMIVNFKTKQIEECNQTTEIVFGYKREELINQDISLLHVNKEMFQFFRNELLLSLENKTFLEHEFQMKRKNGEIFASEHFVRPLYEKTGHLHKVVSVIRGITDRKQAQKAQRESLNLLQKVLSSLNEAVLIIDPYTTQIEECNQTTELMFGYRREEILNQNTYFLHVNEEMFLQFGEELLLAFEDNGFFETEFQMKRKNGEIFASEHFVTPLYEETGQLYKVVSVIRDISERKRAELQFRQLMESAPDAMVIVNRQGIITHVNAQTEKLFGYARTELLGKQVEILMPERYRGNHQRHRASYFNAPHTRSMRLSIELYGLRQDGSEFPVDINLSPIETAEGTLVSTAIRDITERKQAEEILRNLVEGVSAATGSDFLQTLVEYLANTLQVDYVFIAQKDHLNKIRTIAAFAHNQSIDFEYELSNTLCEEVISGDVLRAYPQAVQQAFPLDTMLVEMKVESYFGTPLFNSNGSVIGLMAIMDSKPIKNQKLVESMLQIFANRTSAELERIQALEALQQERASLAQRVTERTAELTAANAELARAARLKNEFLANMSHELRTPLNAILGMTEVLQEEIYGLLNQQQTKSLHTIEESGRHLLSLINDILDLAKIEAGKVKLEISPVSAEGIANACLRFIKELALKKHLKTSMTFDYAVTIIQADERYLKQILLNLLSNAIKFTPKRGAVNLEIRGNAEQGVVDFIVSDTGIGIAEEDMKHLFKPFMQLDSGLNRAHEGTGLGLSLVYRLTEMHGGSVSVESELGKGSRFTISLPWQHNLDELLAAEEPTARLQATPSILVHQQGTVILLVDDNPTIIETLCDYLEAKGYQVIAAHNGIQAIDKTKEIFPDIILMDIQMPGMDGLEAMRRIRADVEVAEIPIIALTAKALPGDKEQCLEAGANDYLSKPVSFKGLVAAIERLMPVISYQ
jgi:PAS domain S-box-containing protein